jgi:serine phosphatase RsbU (regulator of sigma subunit)
MEKLLQAIKNKIKNYKTDLSTNLLSKGVNDIEEFKRVYGYGQGLDKSLEIINETIEKYQKGDIEDDD